MRLVTRGLGLITTLFVARLVSPAELGTFAIVVIPDAGLLAISELGLGPSLVQMQKDPAPYVNTAWTMQVTRGVVLFLAEVLLAPLWCDFFRVPEAVWPMRVLALGQLCFGLQSMAPALLRREFRFDKIFVNYFVETIFHAGVTLGLALYFHNLWAPLLGIVISRAARSVSTYAVHPLPMRLGFDRARAAEMFRFSRWLSLQSAADFVLQTFDNMVTGRVIGKVPLAEYRMAYQLATEGPLSLQWVVSSVAFPAFARVQADVGRVRSKFRAMHGMGVAVMLPLCALIVALGDILIPLLVGPRWAPAATPLRILIFGALIRSVLQTAFPLLQGLGHSRADFLLKGVQMIALCLLLYPAARYWGIPGVAMAVVIAAATALPVWAHTLRKLGNVSATDMIQPVVVPVLATVAGLALLWLLPAKACTWSHLVGYGSLFLATYGLVSFCAYRIMPKSGFGSMLVEMKQLPNAFVCSACCQTSMAAAPSG